jgi:molecular chaperone GrpE
MWDFDNNGYGRRQSTRRNETVMIPVRQSRENNGNGRTPSPAPTPPDTKKPAEAIDWQEKYTRLAAEIDNNKKRLARNYANQYEQDKEALLRDFLPVVDNLERVLAHATGGAAEAAMRQGIELTYKAFREVLAQRGVRPIEAQGKPFDPNLHEAVATIPQPGVSAGTILRVEETGYTLAGKLLRPARVLVAG